MTLPNQQATEIILEYLRHVPIQLAHGEINTFIKPLLLIRRSTLIKNGILEQNRNYCIEI
jgi:hypothetical protein